MANRLPLSRRVSLTAALVAINAGLVLFAVVCLLGVATVVQRDLADQQALARVELAGAAAVDQVGRTEDELRTAARLLAEGPSLGPLAGNATLEQFRAAGNLDGCALWWDGRESSRPWSMLISSPN